jgi:molecular chaperone GrpE
MSTEPELPPETPEALMQEAASRIAELETKRAELETERDDFRDRWMRSEAEIQNVRTRAKREVEETRQYAVQKFARDVVEAAENLRRGLDSLPAPKDDEPNIVTKMREGFEGIERSFVGLLERNGIAKIDPTGALFDANFHQAMAEQPSADHPPGTVLQAWSQAWTLNGRLLRPAMVVVAKAPDATSPGTAPAATTPQPAARPVPPAAHHSGFDTTV